MDITAQGQKMGIKMKTSSNAVYMKMSMDNVMNVESWIGKSVDENFYEMVLGEMPGKKMKTAFETTEANIAGGIEDLKKGLSQYTELVNFSEFSADNFKQLSGKKDGDKLTIVMEDSSGSGTIVIEGNKMLSIDMAVTTLEQNQTIPMSIKAEFEYGAQTITIPSN